MTEPRKALALFDRLPPGWGWWVALLPPLGVAAYLLIGMALTHVVDTDLTPDPGPVAQGQSRAVAMTARLIRREVDDHPWTANDPFFQPGWWLDDMPNFQMGMVGALAHFVSALAETSDQGQGSDPELTRAGGLLKYPGTIWKFDPRAAWAPTASTEKQYRNAARNLDSFNQYLAQGDTALPQGAAALGLLVSRMGLDLAASSSDIDQHLAQRGWLPLDMQSDDVFFAAKGRVYGTLMVLTALKVDFQPLLTERGLTPAWDRMEDSLRTAALLSPLVVTNGAPDGVLFASHLTALGFHLLRARVQLDEIARTLTAQPARP